MSEELPFEVHSKQFRHSLDEQIYIQNNNYLYDHLAEYLYNQGEIAKLKSLFADHHWLHARVQQGDDNSSDSNPSMLKL